MNDLVIKGELHSSRADFEEERDLLAEGIDTLVIEGQEGEAEYGWLYSWFGIAILIFEYLFAQFLYTDSQTLVDIAKGQNANVVYTRKSDAELIENSHGVVVGIACVLFYGLLLFSVVYGLVFDTVLGGAAILLMSALGPILLLRGYEMWKSTGSRDEQIAQKIVEATEDGGRVVAVMGQKHAVNVQEYLPDELDPDIREPQYGVFSFPMLRDLVGPLVRLTGTMSVVYPVILLVAEIYLSVI